MPGKQPCRALLIDDDPAILTRFSHHLTAAGCKVHASADPRRGYDEAGSFAPDVVLLDISMPAINGLELLTVFRQHAGFTGTQVALVSSSASLPVQLDAMSHGAQNYLVKPVQPHDMVKSALNNAAREAAFRDLVQDDPLLKTVELASRPLLPGAYFWRVGSVQADGDTGPWGDARRCTQLPPSAPPHAAETTTAIQFSWAGEPGQLFVFQTASEPSFNHLLENLTTPEITVSVARPPAGVYFSRLRAIDADGFIGPFTAAQRFEVQERMQDGTGGVVTIGDGKPERVQ